MRFISAIALYQRAIPEEKVQALIDQHLIGRSLGIFGEPQLNVLELNLALERAFPQAAADKLSAP